MLVNVLLFAAAKQLVQRPHIQVSLAAGETVGQLRRAIRQDFPELESLVSRSAIAVDHQYATDDVVLTEAVEVGLIPPVSGG